MATQVILNNGAMQRLLTIPDKGLLVRLTVNGKRLVASFEEETSEPSAALQLITWALENSHIQVEPVLDKDNPFNVYNPGVVCGN